MAKGGGAPPSILDRLMRRGRKGEDTSDDGAKKDSPDNGADDTIVAGDSTGDSAADTATGDSTGDSSTETGDSSTETGDGAASDTGTEGTIDDNATDDSTDTAIVDGGSEDDATVGAGDDTQGTVDDGSVDGQAVNVGDGDAADGAISDVDAPPAGTGVDPRTLQELDDPIGPFVRARGSAKLEPAEESALEHDARLIKEATEPQLDPELVQARIGGRGPQPQLDPDGPPDDLAFGEGAPTPGAPGLDPSVASSDGVSGQVQDMFDDLMDDQGTAEPYAKDPPSEADPPPADPPSDLALEDPTGPFVRVGHAPVGRPGQSSLAEDVRVLDEASADGPDIVTGAGAGAPGGHVKAKFEPPDPDDAPDDLAFGKGAAHADGNAGLEAVDDGVDPVAANPPDDGLDPLEPALSDTGIDPVGGAPPDDGLGPHEIRIDDTTDHSEPTEIDID